MDKKIFLLLLSGYAISVTKQITPTGLDARKQALGLHLRYNRVLDEGNLENARKLVIDYRNLLSDNRTYEHQKLRTHCARNIGILTRTFGQVINNL